MPMRVLFAILLSISAITLTPGLVCSHGGGLDVYGCHHDRKYGGYHCHRGELAGRAFASQAEMLAARQQSYVAIPRTVQFSGKVVSVLDGDTIEVLHNKRAQRIRLHGIDCPERGQAYGNKAKQAASALAFGKEVTLQVYGQDQYGRTLADVLLSDGTNVNHELVKDGWCWWYRKYAPADSVLEKLEKEAREDRKGLWADPSPVPPWAYRKAKRGQSLDPSDMVTFGAETEGSVSSRGPPGLGAVPPDSSTSPSSYSILGNRRSHIYHRPDCPNYSQIAPKNRVRFNSAAEAEAAGYRQARNCP